jgi:hypothetical protein
VTWKPTGGELTVANGELLLSGGVTVRLRRIRRLQPLHRRADSRSLRLLAMRKKPSLPSGPDGCRR